MATQPDPSPRPSLLFYSGNSHSRGFGGGIMEVTTQAAQIKDLNIRLPKPKEVEVSTDKIDEGTAKPKDGTSDESTAPTTVFRYDEIIAEFLVSMSQNKAKQKGSEEMARKGAKRIGKPEEEMKVSWRRAIKAALIIQDLMIFMLE
ncbi:hypothetical protein Tco_0286522 [Tanacetum coccineum]